MLRWKSPPGITGSALAILVFGFGLVAQVVAAVRSPLPKPPHFLASVLGCIVVVVLWAGYMVVVRRRGGGSPLLIPIGEIDLKTGMGVEMERGRERDVERDVESVESVPVSVPVSMRTVIMR